MIGSWDVAAPGMDVSVLASSAGARSEARPSVPYVRSNQSIASSLTGGSRGLVVPRPFPGLLRPEHHRVFFYLYAILLAVVLCTWWLVDRSRFGLGLKAIREDEDKAEALGTPTYSYKLIVFVLSSVFTALAGGLYALWFGDLDPVFQFSVLTGSYLVLMALLGGVRTLYGPLIGALVVGISLEYFKSSFGNTPLHLVATGVLLAVVVLVMPDGVLPALAAGLRRLRRREESSIREVTAADLAEQRRAERPGSGEAGPGAAGLGAAGSGAAGSGAAGSGTVGSGAVGSGASGSADPGPGETREEVHG